MFFWFSKIFWLLAAPSHWLGFLVLAAALCALLRWTVMTRWLSVAAALLLVVAGIIEGFVSAGGYGVAARLAASAASLGLLAAYLLNGVKFRAASSASGSPKPRFP